MIIEKARPRAFTVNLIVAFWLNLLENTENDLSQKRGKEGRVG